LNELLDIFEVLARVWQVVEEEDVGDDGGGPDVYFHVVGLSA